MAMIKSSEILKSISVLPENIAANKGKIVKFMEIS